MEGDDAVDVTMAVVPTQPAVYIVRISHCLPPSLPPRTAPLSVHPLYPVAEPPSSPALGCTAARKKTAGRSGALWFDCLDFAHI